MEEREDLISFPEKTEITWRRWFKEFDEKIWPVFKEHGFTKKEAILLYQDNCLYNHIDALLEVFTPED